MSGEYREIHLLRFVEGHARLAVSVKDREVVAKFSNLEGSRYLTRALRDTSIFEVPLITSRICGVCYGSHILASVKAIEKALGVRVPEDTESARSMVHLGNVVQSHIMHLVFMSIPPLKEVDSAFKIRELTEPGLAVSDAVTRLIKLVGGREVHAPNPKPGGLSKAPSRRRLLEELERVSEILPTAVEFAEKVLDLDLPDVDRERPMACALDVDRALVSSTGEFTAEEFFAKLKGVERDYSTSLHVEFNGGELTVGALPRVLMLKELNDKARELAERVEWKPNPFLNVKAQAVEVVHIIEEFTKMAEVLRDASLENVEVPLDAEGRGVALIRAPRGTLIHFCHVERGLIKRYKVVVPTGINSMSIERDAVHVVMQFRKLGVERLKVVLEDLVRSYDPCLSCAVSLDVLERS